MTLTRKGPFLLIGLMFPAGLLSGCAGPFGAAVAPTPTALSGPALHGSVHGGQPPIVGAAVYLYAASTAGYGTANSSLLKTTDPGVSTDGSGNGYVTTGAGGFFTITSDYTCPSSSTLVYMVAYGGNPGISGTVDNTAIGLMAALGPCGGLSASTDIQLSELSTVAAVTALAPFMSSTGAVATSSTNVAGLTNAFTTATNLVPTSAMTPNTTTPGGLGAVPYEQINTLADVLAACINTSSSASSQCVQLFTAATTPSGSVPANTVQAMLNIAHYPAQNVASLYGLVTTDAPYQPTLPAQYNSFTGLYTGQPNDWTVAVLYTSTSLPGNPLNIVNYLALDSQSNVWAVAANGYAVRMSNTGTLQYNIADSRIQTSNFYQSLAVDLSDNLWVDNNSYSALEITSAGSVVCSGTLYCLVPGPGTNQGNLAGNYPTAFYLYGYGGIAVDSSNNLWFGSNANSASGLVETNSSAVGQLIYMGGGLDVPAYVAIDPSGNLWVANQSYVANTVTEVSPGGTFVSGSSGYSAGGLNRPSAIAFDASGRAWIPNYVGQSLTLLTGSGAAVTGSPFTGGGLDDPTDAAVDGAGNVWVSNWASSGVTEFSGTTLTALSPANGYYIGGAYGDQGSVAVDSSGNVWLSSWGAGGLVEMVGVAAPTVNPVAAATKNGTLGTEP